MWIVWDGHSCPPLLNLFGLRRHEPVIPTAAGAPATAEWRNLLSADSATTKATHVGTAALGCPVERKLDKPL